MFGDLTPKKPYFFRTITGLVLIFGLATVARGQDDLSAGIARLQESLSLIVGDGTFDLSDEDLCRRALWTHSILLKRDNEERRKNLKNESFEVMNLTGQIQRELETQAEYQFLYKRALKRKNSVGHPQELDPASEQFRSACSIIVRQKMNDPELLEIASSARSQATYSVINDLLYQLLLERKQ